MRSSPPGRVLAGTAASTTARSSVTLPRTSSTPTSRPRVNRGPDDRPRIRRPSPRNRRRGADDHRERQLLHGVLPHRPRLSCRRPRHSGERGDARRPRPRRGLGHHRGDHAGSPVRPDRTARDDRRRPPGSEGRPSVHPRRERAACLRGAELHRIAPARIHAGSRSTPSIARTRLIYRSRLNVSQAVREIKEDAALAGVREVQNVVEFIGRSKRGILPGPRTERHVK